MSNRSAIVIDSATPVVLDPAALVPGAAKPEGGTYSVIAGAPPTGPAGGDLTGTYPNPTLAAAGPGATTAGDGENVPVVGIDAKGRVTALSTTPVLGSRVSAVNKQGSAITKGQAVYVYSGGSQKLFVKLAKADSETTSHGILGLVADASIANNDPGYIRVLGELADIDTALLTEGAPVYLSATTAGGLTSTSPVAPNHSTYLGVCTAQHGTHGAIYVAPSAGLELGELHDVLVSGRAAGQVLIVDPTNAYWQNRALVEGDVTGLTTDLAAKVPKSDYTAADKYLYGTGAGTYTQGTVLSGWRSWLATVKAVWNETLGKLSITTATDTALLLTSTDGLGELVAKLRTSAADTAAAQVGFDVGFSDSDRMTLAVAGTGGSAPYGGAAYWFVQNRPMRFIQLTAAQPIDFYSGGIGRMSMLGGGTLIVGGVGWSATSQTTVPLYVGNATHGQVAVGDVGGYSWRFGRENDGVQSGDLIIDAINANGVAQTTGALRILWTGGIVKAGLGLQVSDLTAARPTWSTTSGRLTSTPQSGAMVAVTTSATPVTVPATGGHIRVVGAAGAKTVNLPAGAGVVVGTMVTVFDSANNASGGTITITPNGTDTVTGANQITTNGGARTVVYAAAGKWESW